MKKLMTLMLGLALVTGTVAVTFAQDTKSDTPARKRVAKRVARRRATTPRRALHTSPFHCWDAARLRGAHARLSRNLSSLLPF